jgi:uncharacterized membrane protein
VGFLIGARSSRAALLWAAVRDSLWFIPTLSVAAAITLAAGVVRIPTPRLESELAWIWLVAGGAEGARGVLSAIAGGLITVTGVVFSVTIVALQLASTQFTPRVLRSFVADRVNQVVLGIFIGTFTYTLLVLRAIHTAPGGEETFVPQVGVTLAVVLLLVSIGALIVFINHSAQSVQAATILHRETRQTLRRIDELFPAPRGDLTQRTGQAVTESDVESDATDPDPEETEGEPGIVTSAESGYLQAVHVERLWKRTRGRTLTVRMELHIGAFAMRGTPLAAVWPADAVDDALCAAVHDAFVLGPDRTPQQDVEFGIIELSDIAVRALSPGVNDPTTAMRCLDRLGEVLVALGGRRAPGTVRVGSDGSLRFMLRGTTFERAAGLSFDQIRHYGAENPAIAKKMIEVLHDVGIATPRRHHDTLAGHVRAILRDAQRLVRDPDALTMVESLGAAALERLTAPETPTATL